MMHVVKITFGGVLWRQISICSVLGRACQEFIQSSIQSCATNKSWPVNSMRRKTVDCCQTVEHQPSAVPSLEDSLEEMVPAMSQITGHKATALNLCTYIILVLELSLTWVLLQSIWFKRIQAWTGFLDSESLKIMTKYKSSFSCSFWYAFSHLLFPEI